MSWLGKKQQPQPVPNPRTGRGERVKLAPYIPFAVLALSSSVTGCQTAETETISKCFPAGDCGNSTPVNTSRSAAKKPVFSADSGDASKGRKTYNRLCVTCHGTDGKGAASMMMVQDLSSGVWQQTRTDAEIRMLLQRGKGQMPAFPQLKANETRNLIRYVRTLRKAPKTNTGSGY